MEVVASLSQGRTAAAQCSLFTHKSVPVIFEPPCTILLLFYHSIVVVVVVIIIIINFFFRFTSDTLTHAPDCNNRIVMTSAVHLSTNDCSDYCQNLMASTLGPANLINETTTDTKTTTHISVRVLIPKLHVVQEYIYML